MYKYWGPSRCLELMTLIVSLASPLVGVKIKEPWGKSPGHPQAELGSLTNSQSGASTHSSIALKDKVIEVSASNHWSVVADTVVLSVIY